MAMEMELKRMAVNKWYSGVLPVFRTFSDI